MPEKLHPKIDNGLPKESASFSGGTLVCACTSKPVKVKVKGQIAHNHACGCTKCWKPEGAVFSVVAVAGTGDVTVTENGDKLKVVDPSALIQRHACTGCGVHMHGPVERDHPFKGLSFIHPERFEEDGWSPPGFTAFGGARGRTDVPKIVDWYMDGKIQIDPMITHTLKLEDINKGFDLMHEGKSIRSVVVY